MQKLLLLALLISLCAPVASYAGPGGGSNPLFMKGFAEKVYDLFNHEPQLRAAALEMAREQRAAGKKNGFPSDSITDLLKSYKDKTGMDLEGFFTEDQEVHEKLGDDELRIVRTTYEGIVFYLMLITVEEGVKAGLMEPPGQRESETPEAIKHFIKNTLAPYIHDRPMPSKDEVKKEIEAMWKDMTAALADGDVDGAAGFFSSRTRNAYRVVFQSLVDKGMNKNAAGDIRDMKVDEVSGIDAQGDIRAVQDGKTFSYHVRFTMEEEGKWKIVTY